MTSANITGDLGISPNDASSITGPCAVTGTTNVAAAAAGAKTDLVTAYNTLAGLACNTDLTGQDLGGLTLTPGVYCFSSSAQLTGTLTLNAQGNPDAVFVFQIGSTLTTASSAAVSVINGGPATGCGVSWQVGSSATLGTGTAFVGNIVALASNTLNTGAVVSPGRVLARNTAVTLNASTVSAAACVGYGGTGLPPAPGQGSITIVKNASGGNGTFNFTAGAQSFSILTVGDTVSGTGSNATTFASVAPNIYDVTESVPAGWNLTSITCSNASTVDLDKATAHVAVAADEAVTCTFTDTLLPPPAGQGSITIVKNTIGGNGTFNFTGAQSFLILTTGGTGSDTTAFASVDPGTYDVTETVPAGWNLTGLTCSNGSMVNVGTATANVAVAADEAVTCTFTNARQGSITIVKNTIGGNGTFNYSGAQSFSIATNAGTGSDSAAFSSVIPGTYNVTETVPAGWNLTGLTCSNGSTASVGAATAWVTVAAGAAVICTFTNTLALPLPPSAPANIPTLGEWALIALAMMLAVTGGLYYRRC
jgi:uncharacterized protein YbdZ (MbtH family)